MPKSKVKKTDFELAYPYPATQLLRFAHSGRYSPLVRAMRFALLGACGDIEADLKARDALNESEQVTDESLFSLETTRNFIRARLDKQETSRRLLPYISHYAKEGVPFSDFEDEPAQVSQFKKIVNALYHSEEALKIIESLDIESLFEGDKRTLQDAFSLAAPYFIDHVYKLCKLVTHPDIDVTFAFGDEWRRINMMLFDICAKMPQRYWESNQFLSREYGLDFTEKETIAKQLGLWTGNALEAVKPTRQMNYSTVSYFGAEVSTYLNRLTKVTLESANQHLKAPYLNQDGVKIEHYEIPLERRYELERASVRLEDALNSLVSGPQILQPFKAYALVGIFRNAVILVESIIKESGQFRAGSEELIRLIFAQLKYQFFLELIRAVDKIEEEAVLEPGVLSINISEALDDYYRYFFDFVSSFVDLSARGQDLSRLIDSRLIECRQQSFYERQGKREASLLQSQLSEKSLDVFFSLLSQYRGRRLSELNSEQKNELFQHFAVIQPLVAEDDIALSNTIAEALLPKTSSTDAPRVPPQNMGLGERILDDLVYTGKQIYNHISSAYAALDEYSRVPRRYFGDYADRVELLDDGYTFELLAAADDSASRLSDYAPGALFSSQCIYIRVIDGKIALTIKKPNGSFFSDMMTPFDAPVTDGSILSLENLAPLRQDILDFCKKNGWIRPSLYERIQHRIKKEEATCKFKAVMNADCRAKIYKASGELLQHAYPKKMDVYVQDVSDLLGPGASFVSEVDLSEVPLEKLRELYSRYTVFCNQLDDAESAMQAFFEMIERIPAREVVGVLVQKNDLRHLYAQIQPYFVSSLRQLKGDKFADNLDQSLICSFSGLLNRGKSLDVKELLACKADVLRHIRQHKMTTYPQRDEIRTSIARHMFETKRPITSLVIDNPYGARSGYLVKNPQYTQYMKKVMEQLEQFTKKLFSPEIQKKLVPSAQENWQSMLSTFVFWESRTLPFPEVDEINSVAYLKEEKQVIGLKQFYNCIHHLREIAVQIEQLSEESYDFIYVWRTTLMEEHARHVILLYQDLMQNKYLLEIGTDLYQLLNDAISVIQTLSLDYAPEKLDKDTHIEAVRHPVFYIANALVVAREQIDAWQKSEYISRKQQEDAQKFGEITSRKICKVLETNTYLGWVLQSDMFYDLFIEAKDRWNRLAVSSTNAIEQNLESIYTENFTNILIEADTWERRMGLAPGLISKPLKEILDAYYLGMIEILSDNKRHEINLATTQVPFNKRLERVAVALETEHQTLITFEKNLSSISQFKTWYEAHSEAVPLLWTQCNTEDKENYDAFLVLLRQVMSVDTISESIKAMIEPSLMSVLFLERQPEPVEIGECRDALKKSIEFCEAFFEGNKKTTALSLNHAYLQRDMLRESLVAQDAKNHEIKNEMIKKLVFKMLSNHQSGSPKLPFVKELYDQALQEEIESHMDIFLQNISKNESIENQVRKFLDDKVGIFNKNYFDDFHKFNQLHYALSELQSYLNSQNTQLMKINSTYKHTWAFESDYTLALKSRLHQSLRRILEGKKTSDLYHNPDDPESPEDEKFDPDDRWHIKARMKRFEDAVTKPRFAQALLQMEEGRYKIYPLSYLVKWLVDVLRILGLYKTEAEIIHEQLKKYSRQSTASILNTLNKEEKNLLVSNRSKSEQTDAADLRPSRHGMFSSSSSSSTMTPEHKPPTLTEVEKKSSSTKRH